MKNTRAGLYHAMCTRGVAYGEPGLSCLMTCLMAAQPTGPTCMRSLLIPPIAWPEPMPKLAASTHTSLPVHCFPGSDAESTLYLHVATWSCIFVEPDGKRSVRLNLNSKALALSCCCAGLHCDFISAPTAGTGASSGRPPTSPRQAQTLRQTSTSGALRLSYVLPVLHTQIPLIPHHCCCCVIVATL